MSDFNVGMGMYYDTPEDKEIERLSKANTALRSQMAELQEHIKDDCKCTIERYEAKVAELQAKLDEMGKQEPAYWFYEDRLGNGSFMNMPFNIEGEIPLYRLSPNTSALIEQAVREEREAALKDMRKAVIALAHAAESNPVYQDAYKELDAAIRARKP